MNWKNPCLFTFYILLITGAFSGSLLMNGCSHPEENGEYKLTGDTLADGKNLVQINCTKCHELVPVNALNKNVWKYHTLPAMSHYLGISAYMGGYYKGDKDTIGNMSVQAWQMIVSYYQKMAPDTLLTPQKPTPLLNDWAGFTLKKPAEGKTTSFTTLTASDTTAHLIYTADAVSNKLTEWDSNFKNIRSINLPSTAVNVIFNKDSKGNAAGIFSCIGEMKAMDFPNGKILNINTGGTNDTTKKVIAEDIERPVQTITGDFNKDGLNDYVVLAQGHFKGGVYLYKQNADHSYTKTDISDKPGAVQAVTRDFNNDGWPDLMVLFGSNDEGLWIFLNDHKGGFTSKNVLRFPPVYGSTSFQLADMDHDGKPDLIYTCGYNFKDSRILKPYHGVYIFKNMGNWNFKQKWFFPINGCTKAIAADFDGDGDLDIATSAFFADLKNTPAESFIYFEQISPFNFKAHAIPISKYGRWMTMEVADYNHDGKPDILLGNYSKGYVLQTDLKPFWDTKTPFIVLQNDFKK